MSVLVAVFLLGLLGSKIPSDADIAARIEDTIRTQLHPDSVRVTVKRTSSLSTTVERLEITISGFNGDHLPLGNLNTPAPASPASTTAPTRNTETTTQVKPRHAERQIRIIDAHIVCENFVINALPVKSLELTGHEVRIPWQAVRTGAFEISAADTVSGILRLKEGDLTKFMQSREADLPITHPAVQVLPGECIVSGTTRTFAKLPIQLSGHLTARNGAVLYLDNPRLKVSVVPIPKLVSDRVLRDLNPLADLNTQFQLPAPLSITKTVQEDGLLRFEAALLFPSPEEK